MKIYFFFLHSSFLPPNYYFRCHLHTFNPNDMSFLLLDFGGKEVKHEIKITLLLPKCVLNRLKLFSMELFGPYHNRTWYVCQLHTKSDIFIAQTRQGYNNQASTHIKNVCITLLIYTISCQHQRLIILITWMNGKTIKDVIYLSLHCNIHATINLLRIDKLLKQYIIVWCKIILYCIVISYIDLQIYLIVIWNSNV